MKGCSLGMRTRPVATVVPCWRQPWKVHTHKRPERVSTHAKKFPPEPLDASRESSTHEYHELSMSTQGRLDHEYEYSGALWIMSMNTPKFQDQVDPT